MAHTKFPVEVLTPEGEVFAEEVEQISTRTAVGSIGILAGHQPLLAMLDPTELRLYRSESDVVSFAQAEGYLQVTATGCWCWSRRPTSPTRWTPATCASASTVPSASSSEAGEDSERRRVAERDKRRLEAFLRIAEGG